MNVLIAGGTGLIGSALVELLHKRGDSIRVLTRGQARPSDGQVQHVTWNNETAASLGQQVSWSDAVVNLAGANIGARRWSKARKSEILNSRVESTEALVAAVRQASSPPAVFVQASAVGLYGYHPIDSMQEENSPIGTDFLATVCRDWENAANPARDENVRLAVARFGIVLSPKGGALARMLLPAKLGAGGRIGHGRQPFPWIHIQDAVGAIAHLLDSPSAHGPFNIVSPQRCTNGQFAQSLARAVRRPILLFLPSFQVRLIFGEMGDMLLQGQCASAQKLLDSGFAFSFEDRDTALRDLV